MFTGEWLLAGVGALVAGLVQRGTKALVAEGALVPGGGGSGGGSGGGGERGEKTKRGLGTYSPLQKQPFSSTQIATSHNPRA